MSDTRGLYDKYRVTKADGTPLDGPCFVLRYDRDPAARRALFAYADSLPYSQREFAIELRREGLKWEPHRDGTIDGLVEVVTDSKEPGQP